VELQLDYDCPESKLAVFTGLVRDVKAALAGIPVTITALPSWMGAPGFAGLIAAADGYVLQVHSLERPGAAGEPYSILDPAAARAAVRRANSFDRPFRIALPTYGYVLAYDALGRCIGLSAEGPKRDWPAGARLRTVRSDPGAVAALVKEWSQSPPREFQGLIWYRLPVEGDRLNWSWPTLAAVMAGRIPAPKLEVQIRYPDPKLAEFDFVNNGDGDASLPLEFTVSCPGARFVAGDALHGYEASETSPSEWRFLRRHEERLAPGGRHMAGWIRLARPAKLEIAYPRAQ
jgi:hypothetical protein